MSQRRTSFSTTPLKREDSKADLKSPESKLTRRPSMSLLARAGSMIMGPKITDKPPELDEFKSALQFSDSIDQELKRACELEIKSLREKTDDPRLPDAGWAYTAAMLQNKVDSTFLTRTEADTEEPKLPKEVTKTMTRNEIRLVTQDPKLTAQLKEKKYARETKNRDAEQKAVAQKEAEAKAAEKAANDAARQKAADEAKASGQKYVAPPKIEVKRELTKEEKIDRQVASLQSKTKKLDRDQFYNPIAAIEARIDMKNISGLTGTSKDSIEVLNKVASDLDAYSATQIQAKRRDLDSREKEYKRWLEVKEKPDHECKALLDKTAEKVKKLKHLAAITNLLIPELKSGEITTDTLQRAREFEQLFYDALELPTKLRTTRIMLDTVQAIVDQRPFVIQYLHDKFDLEPNLDTTKPIPFVDRRSSLNYFLAYNQPKLMAMTFKNLMNTKEYKSQFEGKTDGPTLQAAVAFLYAANPAAHMSTPENARDMRMAIRSFLSKGGDEFEKGNPTLHTFISRSCLALAVEQFNLLEQLKLEAATASPKGAGSKRRATVAPGSQSLPAIDEKHAHKSVSASVGSDPGSPALTSKRKTNPTASPGQRVMTHLGEDTKEQKDIKKSPSARRGTAISSASTTPKPSVLKRAASSSTTANLGKIIGSESLIAPFNQTIEPAQAQSGAKSSTKITSHSTAATEAQKDAQQTIDLPGSVPESKSPTKRRS